MKLLAIDSSGLVASVAVAEDDRLLGEYTIDRGKTHSESLLPMIAAVLDMLELEVSDMDAIAVSSGPGSFTGLRIGAATAKGLAFAKDIPIVPVPTLDALAYTQWQARGIVCPLMDARRNQTYTGLYRFDDVGDLVSVQAACVVPVSDIILAVNELKESVIFLGDGVPVFRERIEMDCKVPYLFAPLNGNRQHASAVAALGMKLFEAKKAVPASSFAPEYMRMSQAQRERLENSRVSVRDANTDDIPWLYKLSDAAMTEVWSEKAFSDALENENALVIAAFLESPDTGKSEPVGYSVFYTAADEAELPQIAVDENFRRARIASGMMKTAFERLRDKGVSSVFLEVRKSNLPAIAFYEAEGFVRQGVRKDFYASNDGYAREDALIYRRDL